ncbi:MAG TPA: LicD family protein [Mariniphaga sp.]|nr:LicD family protein [Mariniphaga sp.]
MKDLYIGQIKEIQLELLSKLDSFCRKNQIKYFLAYGTLLGAVRHQGYIPWDDDIDILMPRPDYKIFIKNYNKTSIDSRVYDCFSDSQYPYFMAKLSSEKTRLEEETNVPYEKIGVNIDIFPLDGAPDTEFKKRMILLYRSLLHTVSILKTVKLKNNRELYKNLILTIGNKLCAPLGQNMLARKLNEIASQNDYTKSEEVICLASPYGKKDVMFRSDFEKIVELDFEKKKYFAPHQYNRILKQLYGDYMAPPPEKFRVTHHAYRAYWK